MVNASNVRIYTIAAVAQNRVIGRDGRLPWRIEADWQQFLSHTAGGVLIMGRRSFEDMRNEPRWRLDGRTYVVISRDRSLAEPGFVDVASSSAEARELAANQALPLGRNIWVCGGTRIYEDFLGWSDALYLTLLDADFEGDTYFPEWRKGFSREEVIREMEEEGLRFKFTLWRR